MRYVDEKSDAKARELERKFADLAPEAGVLFVSVRPDPTEGGQCHEFFVHLGIIRRLEEGAGRALVQLVLKEELENGLKVYAAIHRGISCACRDDGPPPPHPPAS